MKPIIGFNTGGFDDTELRVSVKSISFLKSLGCNAIEFNPKDIDGIKRFNDIKRSDLDGFEYVSLHAPHIQMSSPELIEILDAIAYHHKRLKFNTIVIHPVDILDFNILKNYSLPISLENMDWMKTNYRFVEEMKQVIATYHYPLVFDIQHAFTHDRSGMLANSFIKEFKNHISEIHISGLEDNNDHGLLFEKQQSHIISRISDDIPIIIESYKPSDNLEELRTFLEKELDYIRNNLQ